MCASTALFTFMQDKDVSLREKVRFSVEALRNRHDLYIADFDKLDSEISEPYNAAPALPVSGGELYFVRDRYEALFRQQADFAMAVVNFVCKSDPDADSDLSHHDASPPHL